MLVRGLALATAAGLVAAPFRPAAAALPAQAKAILVSYLQALQSERYAAAFALLSSSERAYFGSSQNFASAYRADRLSIASFKVLGSMASSSASRVAIVNEHVRFFDFSHQRTSELAANVQYAIVPVAGGLAIKDPFHPWRAFVPDGAMVERDGLRATVRKVSFFTGRVELMVTFANYGTEAVTVLPYGRTVLRDDARTAHVPLATRLGSLTDRTLYEGLRLAPRAQYTGALTFVTVDRYMPKQLMLTVAPVVADGADAPAELQLPTIGVPASH